jgi:catechol 2,3-dioxygenase-like lactoylglutathione lyase family enzyme
MPTVEVTGLNVLAVYATDAVVSEAFYRDHLGFEKVEDLPPGILMKAGEVTLYLEGGRAASRPESSDKSVLSPCFATASVQRSFKAMKSAGVRIAHDYEALGPGFALFRICDPDGNLIEFAGKP